MRADKISFERVVRVALPVIEALTLRKLTLAVAESCTGGLLASVLTEISGASRVFVGGVIAYQPAMKEKMLHVPPALIKGEEIYSPACARAMAEGAVLLCGAHLGVGVTGVAGPEGGTARYPVGSVSIAVHGRGERITSSFSFRGDRNEIRLLACEEAIKIVWEQCKKMKE